MDTHRMKRTAYRNPRILGLVLAVALGLALLAGIWLAFPARVDAISTAGGPLKQTENDACLACHSTPGQTAKFSDGELLSITIDKNAYAASVHGSSSIACMVCHKDISDYPHPAITAQSQRDYTYQQQNACKPCHDDKYQLTTDSVHNQALQNGNQEAPVCSDCHNPHTQGAVIDKSTNKLLQSARVLIPQTCARCHNAIYTAYKDSVHGGALVDGNPDVPTCTDCHGVHNIGDPTTNKFRLSSPQMCAKCHTDNAIMGKYGLSTQVLNTYIADFHGTTVTLFQKLSPDQQTNKPVCFDCHGVHNIALINDPQKGLQIKENILVACKRCHPDANTNFPDSWLSHYIPDAKHSPLVYYLNGFYYWFLIPVVIGGMVVYVFSDAIRRRKDRRNNRQKEQQAGQLNERQNVHEDEQPGDQQNKLLSDHPGDNQEGGDPS
jgi:hypothetical protein